MSCYGDIWLFCSMYLLLLLKGRIYLKPIVWQVKLMGRLNQINVICKHMVPIRVTANYLLIYFTVLEYMY